jgi:DNA primase
MADGSDPFERVVAALRKRGAQVLYRSADSVRATCPAHLDRRPSLCVTRREGRVLMKCFAGCSNGAIVTALELHLADLFSGAAPQRTPAEIVACYDYHDRDGVLVAQKVRYPHKSFRWRRPDPSARGGWRWGLNGPVPGLYRRPQVLGAREVFIVEGEKAADVLTRSGLVATCPPAGASSWKPDWSSDLWSAGCRELVILADHDRAGERHAERVAADIHALKCDEPVAVTVVLLPGLAPGADVVDWLEGGHSCADLLAIVARTPVWAPGTQERHRTDRRRAQTRERMRRLRASRRAPVSGNGDAADAEAVSKRNAVTLAQTRERVRRHRAKHREARVLTVTDVAGNAQPVTRDAVTQCERSSFTLQESQSREELPDIHSVTQESVTERSVIKKSVTERRVTEGWEAAEAEIDVEGPHPCCEGGPLQLRCALCRQSPTYWQRDFEALP